MFINFQPKQYQLLFNLFINDLIHECIDYNIGDCSLLQLKCISIIFSVRLTLTFSNCSKYGINYRIKCNALKSNIITLGNPLFQNTTFSIKNIQLNKSEKLKYIGIGMNNNLKFDIIA